MVIPKVIDASTRLRRELVESKQTFEPGVSELDPTQQAFFYAYNVLDNQGNIFLNIVQDTVERRNSQTQKYEWI